MTGNAYGSTKKSSLVVFHTLVTSLSLGSVVFGLLLQHPPHPQHHLSCCVAIGFLRLAYGKIGFVSHKNSDTIVRMECPNLPLAIHKA